MKIQGVFDLLLAGNCKEKQIFLITSKKRTSRICNIHCHQRAICLTTTFFKKNVFSVSIRRLSRLRSCNQCKVKADPISDTTSSSPSRLSFWSLKASICTPVSRFISHSNSFILPVLLPSVQPPYNPVSTNRFRFSLVHNTTAFNISFSIDRIYHQNGVAYDYYSQLDLGLTRASPQWNIWPLPNQTHNELSPSFVSSLPLVDAIYLMTDPSLTERHHQLRNAFRRQGISLASVQWRLKWNRTTCNHPSNHAHVYRRLNLKDKPLGLSLLSSSSSVIDLLSSRQCSATQVSSGDETCRCLVRDGRAKGPVGPDRGGRCDFRSLLQGETHSHDPCCSSHWRLASQRNLCSVQKQDHRRRWVDQSEPDVRHWNLL